MLSRCNQMQKQWYILVLLTYAFVIIEDICMWLKKLVCQKIGDPQCVTVEKPKWTGKETHAQINDVFNHGLPYNWNTNWIKPVHKGRDVNNINNNQTIMVTHLWLN